MEGRSAIASGPHHGVIRGAFMGRSWDRECVLCRPEDWPALIEEYPEIDEEWSVELLGEHLLAVEPPSPLIRRLVALGAALLRWRPRPASRYPASSN